uniref:Syd_1 protein n=1 Tax=Fopius arisanus TaxID=64838 RepID=A0A0C9RFF3_9HYME
MVGHDVAKQMEIILADLGEKVPYLQCLLRPEYASYFSTIGTVLLGWIVVSWFINLIWTFLAPLTISLLGVIIICPATAKWMLKQLGPTVESALKEFFTRIQSSLSEG